MATTDPTTDSVSPIDLAKRANALLETGEVEAAYPAVIALAQSAPTYPTLLTAGLIALTLKRSAEARQHFVDADRLDNTQFDAAYNLALLDITEGRVGDAIPRLRNLIAMHDATAPLWNDLGIAYDRANQPGRALACWRRALRIDPGFSLARNNAGEFSLRTGQLAAGHAFFTREIKRTDLESQSQAETKRWLEHLASAQVTVDSGTTTGLRLSNQKIAVFANHRAFITPIMEEFATQNDVRYLDNDDVREMDSLLEWADVAWFEWCDQLVQVGSRRPKTCPAVCRLHSYESFTEVPGAVDWSKIDRLVFVASTIETLVKRRFPIACPTQVISNGVDLDRYRFDAAKPRTKRIAYVGYLHHRKNPILLFHCFKKLHAYDPEFSLHIAGEHQEMRTALYCEHWLQQNPLPIHFDGWVEDIPDYLNDKSYVISSSLWESFHYAVAEGMASGCLPLIHDWPGARQFYPNEFIFDDPDEFLRLVQRCESQDWADMRQANRAFIERTYDHRTKIQEIDDLLVDVIATRRQGSQS